MNWKDFAGQMAPALIEQALDDNGDGIADESAWALVQSDAEERIQSCFGGVVPEPHASAAAEARRLFILESLYNRRGFNEGNPFSVRATNAEKRLRALASGDETTSGDSGAEFIGQPAKVAGITGMMA